MRSCFKMNMKTLSFLFFLIGKSFFFTYRKIFLSIYKSFESNRYINGLTML